MKATIMLKKKGQVTLGKWHFKFGFIPLYQATNLYIFHFGIFKLTSFPSEGYMITKENYKGFWFKKEFFIRGFEINL